MASTTHKASHFYTLPSASFTPPLSLPPTELINQTPRLLQEEGEEEDDGDEDEDEGEKRALNGWLMEIIRPISIKLAS